MIAVLLAASVTLPPGTVRSLLADTAVTTADTRPHVAALQFAPAAQVSADRTPEEIVLRFDRAPDEAEWDRFRKAAGPGLGRMLWNDTSLVLQPAGGWQAAVEIAGAQVRVTLFPDPRPSPAFEDNGAVDYALAHAAADTAAGYPGRAGKRLAALERTQPHDPRVVRAVAEADYARGARGRAAERLRTLGVTDEAALAQRRAAGGEIAVGSTIRDGHGFTQAEVAARATLTVGAATSANVALRTVRTRTDAVVTPQGVRGPVSPVRMVLEGGATMVVGRALRVELLAAAELRDTRVGVSGRVVSGPLEREARLWAAWHVPDLLTGEQALFGGYTDRLGAGGTLRLSPNAAIQLDAAFNSYALKGRGRQATSVTVSAGYDHLLRRRHPLLSIAYRLDAEYVDRLDRVAGALPALPLTDRENHTASLSVAETLGRVYLGGNAGWTVDRFGSNGPTAALFASGDLSSGWRAEASGGVSSIARAGLPGTTLQVRGVLARALGRP